MNLSAFILAAGLGERLRPITNHIPKPLLPILGKPMLETVLEKISALPVTTIGVNLHYKKETISHWFNQSAFRHIIELFPENIVLGTGGGLKNAEHFLKDSTFLVHNADIVSDIDLQQLIDFHLTSHNLATFAVHDYPEFNRLAVDEKGFFKGFNSSSEKLKNVAFTGIAVYDPEFLKFLPAGVSSVIDAWLKAIRDGEIIGTFDITGSYWSDIGTPVAYAKAVINELRRNGEMVYIHPTAKGCQHIEIDGYVAIENESILDQGISLRNCIVLPGTEIDIKDHFENCILGPGFKIDLSESDLFDSADGNSFLIGTGGSDRKYSRVKLDKHSAVLMQSPDGDPDFQRHIEYTLFFRGHSIPVPELIDIASDNKTALFEDFGDLSLYSWLKCPRDRGMIEKMYKKVIDILILIHTEVTEHISECPLLRKRIFDYEHLRWETGYFVERFVEGVSKIKTDNLPELNEEFHRLALKVDSFPKTIVHRDFQSQNIMIAKGGIPRIIDYQGARIGPPAYDLVSILWDPYYRLENDLRKSLLDYYMNIMSENSRWFSQNEFRETMVPCRLQRHMQALGAYGFLSSAKGKKYFLKYIPEGVRLLKEDVSLAKDDYPELYSLVISIP
jgi:NDP-sugar pyrophosphorylase family protein